MALSRDEIEKIGRAAAKAVLQSPALRHKWRLVKNSADIGQRTKVSRRTIQRLIDAVPDTEDPDMLSYWEIVEGEHVYLEGWSDACLAGTGFPPMEEGETERKLDYIRSLTPEILERKAMEARLFLIEGGFIEREDATYLYGVTYGVYRAKPN